MHELRQEYLNAAIALDGDAEGRRAARAYMDASDVLVHEQPLRFPFVPYLFDASDRVFLQAQCETIHHILCKVIARYLDDPSYRDLFSFSKTTEELILLPCSYSQLLPMARFDLFLDEKDRSYKFCEFNTDGSGAMSRDLVMGQALMRSETYRRFAQGHAVRQFELFDSWVAAFLEDYRSCPDAVEFPSVAVTDFAESGVFSDFTRFIEAFERAGCPARFVDTRAFAFDGSHLIDPSDGQRIDAIYRRAVTSELVSEHFDACRALIDAMAAEAVCVIGHFRTTVAHSKMINVALFDEATSGFLTPDEQAFVAAHVPRTYRLATDCDGLDIEEIMDNKDAWIIKPADDYAAHGVYPGVDFSHDEWIRIVKASTDAGNIVQEYYRPPEVDIIDLDVDPADPMRVESWQSMPGVYCYNGRMQGLYCRLGQEGVIALDHNGLAAPSFAVD